MLDKLYLHQHSSLKKVFQIAVLCILCIRYKPFVFLSHSGTTQAEKRKKIIEESKFLGGDMEHTHLVKGLDYALLDKVRAEINNKETNDEDIEAAAEMAEEEIE